MHSVYNVIEMTGTSTESWEKAATAAVAEAAQTLRDLDTATVIEQDLLISDDSALFRTKVRLSFKHEATDRA